ncbi:MAG: hypothetical protein JWP02_3436 [Acidimicrobiales bacterium]|nr:hypothetical protein [Acidimicrobiales bacterium]
MDDADLGRGDGDDPGGQAADDDREERLDQPEDEATEHALRLMNEALRRGDAARRWLIAGDS